LLGANPSIALTSILDCGAATMLGDLRRLGSRLGDSLLRPKLSKIIASLY